MATTQQRIVPRYAHTAGRTSLAYSWDGKYLITVGSNEVIRKFTVASEDEPVTIDDALGRNVAVAASDESFITCSEGGTISLFSMATDTLKQLLVRCTLSARDIALSPDGDWVAVASDETVVKVVNVEDNHKIMNLRSQSQSVKHVSFHPTGNYLAVSCVDGVIYIYSLSTEEPELVKKVDGIIKAMDAESEACSKVAWHPDGRAFAAQTPTRDIIVVDRAKWETHKTFASGHAGDITDFSWSPNGAFLASAGTDGKLVIWETEEQTIVAKYDYRHIVSLAWHPKHNVISFTTSRGELYTLPNAVPDDRAFRLKLTTRAAPLLNDSGPSMVLENRSKPPPSRQRAASVDSLDDILGGMDDGLEDFIIDDDGAGYVEPNRNGKRSSEHLDTITTHGSKRPAYGMTMWSPEIHEPFQPGSTPWKGKRRYLCLNLIGFVWTVDQDTHHTVTVEFYDRDSYRDFHLPDPYLYDKACLNETGTLFSCQPRDENPAMIFYRPHETWATRVDWRTSLPKGEEIVSIALSESYIVVCTSKAYVRVFTLFGVPFRVYRQKHMPFVACASWRDYIFVMGNGAVGADGKTQLTYSIENVKRDEALQCSDVVALPPDGEARNVFFSSDGDPVIYDSEGVLLVLVHWRQPGQAKWVPLLDTRTLDRLASGRKEESYWPVAVAQDKFHCIILKGGEKHPYFPRPLLSEFDFKIPLSTTSTPPTDSSTSSKTDTLEETYVRESILLTLQEDFAAHATTDAEDRMEMSKRVNAIDKTLLQLLGLECQSEDYGPKALEICGLFRQRRTLELAIKVAVRFNQGVLAEKIGELRDRMEVEE
ncbi:WD40 repeat-like protein [Choiromyces venosus 120613-1]|uniref:WD40 repeat-like protein n=1 Tax=Choiromyces venosus 120613-1 TaxID=1336337 RepID=A0A3N4JP48_9PEZI|nr:WD40 repeat-like protein [Choiromyces venosus 120613-1]